MKKYNCPNCSAELYWDAEASALKCNYCEKQYQPDELDALLASAQAPAGTAPADEAPPQEKVARETTDQDKVSDDSSKTDTSDLVVYSCKNCGAEVITSKSTIATTCAFCGRAISLSDKLVGDFAPDALIPFAIDEKKAKEIYLRDRYNHASPNSAQTPASSPCRDQTSCAYQQDDRRAPPRVHRKLYGPLSTHA